MKKLLLIVLLIVGCDDEPDSQYFVCKQVKNFNCELNGVWDGMGSITNISSMTISGKHITDVMQDCMEHEPDLKCEREGKTSIIDTTFCDCD